MRKIEEIKAEMAEAWMRSPVLAAKYGFQAGDAFSSTYSKVSVENILLYIVSVGIYALEVLFEQHSNDVRTLIEETLPHRPKWYRDKALAFMKGKTLVVDSDEYDTTGMTQDEIDEAHVVKYAAATESADASLLTVKIAGEDAGKRGPLDEETQKEVEAYLAVIKDAGVRLAVVNKKPDKFSCRLLIYYDPMLTADAVKSAVLSAVTSYVEKELPFNGEYTNMALIDQVQAVDGVKIAQVSNVQSSVDGETTTTSIDARYTPAAGYFVVDQIDFDMKPYSDND